MCGLTTAEIHKTYVSKSGVTKMPNRTRNVNCGKCQRWFFCLLVYIQLCYCCVAGSEHTHKELLLDALDYYTRGTLCCLS